MNSKTILTFVLLLSIVGGQIYYFSTIHQQNKMKVEDTRLDIILKEEQFKQLENQLEALAQTKETLKQTEMKVTALTNKIPSYMSSAKEFSDMIRIMQTSNFASVTIKAEDVVEHTFENTLFLECKYMLKYIAPFSQSRNFINALNQSNQLLNIASFKIDNAPQMETEKESAYKYLYQEGFNELVQTEVKFSAFVDPQKVETVYDPAINLLTNTQNAFFNVETLIKKEGEVGENIDVVDPVTLPPTTTSKEEEATKFEINVTDILTSGDTYNFVGPSDTEGRLYAGLVGHQDVVIKFTLEKDSYTISLETADGQIIQKEATVKMTKPHLNIYSTMKAIADEMPKVTIYINNHTEEMLSIRLDGTLLGNVTLYNEGKEVLLKGQTKGNIKVY